MNEAGACSGNYECVGYCNSSETGPVGDLCLADQTCTGDLLRAANVHVCYSTLAPIGSKQPGETCVGDSECRSLSCSQLCLGPGCTQKYCQDYCGDDSYCSVSGVLCRLARYASTIDGHCWPAAGPYLGTTGIGEGCSSDVDCDHGFCATDAGQNYCSQACCGSLDCPDGFACSLAGDQIESSYVYAPQNSPACSADEECDTGLCDLVGEGRCAWRLTDTAPMCLSSPETGDLLPGSACTINGDCASGFCESDLGVCVDTCCSDSDCPSGLHCRLQFVSTMPIPATGVERATQARVCIAEAGDEVLQPKQ